VGIEFVMARALDKVLVKKLTKLVGCFVGICDWQEQE
jgi:hypothetical protein